MPTILSGNPTGTFEETQDSAVKIGNPEIFNIPAPASLTGAANTATATQLINGLITVNNGSTASTLTFPPASGSTGLAAALRPFSSRGIVPGDSIYVTITNGGNTTGLLTLSVSGATGMSFDTNTSQTIPVGTGRTLLIRFTSGTPGSETAVIF